MGPKGRRPKLGLLIGLVRPTLRRVMLGVGLLALGLGAARWAATFPDRTARRARVARLYKERSASHRTTIDSLRRPEAKITIEKRHEKILAYLICNQCDYYYVVHVDDGPRPATERDQRADHPLASELTAVLWAKVAHFEERREYWEWAARSPWWPVSWPDKPAPGPHVEWMPVLDSQSY